MTEDEELSKRIFNSIKSDRKESKEYSLNTMKVNKISETPENIECYNEFWETYYEMNSKNTIALLIRQNFQKDKVKIFHIPFQKELNALILNSSELSKLILPFNEFFIDYGVTLLTQDEQYIVNILGLLVKINGKEINIFHKLEITDRKLKRDSFISKISYNLDNPEETSRTDPFSKSLSQIIGKEIVQRINSFCCKMIYFLVKEIENRRIKEYYSYESGERASHKITTSFDVMRHSRHFSSERFSRIKNMNEKELEKYNYKKDENGVYRIVEPFTKGNEDGEKNNEIDLRQKIWKSQQKLGEILKEIFPNRLILSGKKPIKKKGSSLQIDWWLKEDNIGFEYQGEQHFIFPNAFHKTEKDFKNQQIRDRQKRASARRMGITLFEVRFDEPLNKKAITDKIKKKLSNIDL